MLQVVQVMGQAFLQQTEAESSQLLGLVGKLHDGLVLSFKAPTIGQKTPRLQMGSQMEHPMMLPQHHGFPIGFLEGVQCIFNGLPHVTFACMTTNLALKEHMLDANKSKNAYTLCCQGAVTWVAALGQAGWLATSPRLPSWPESCDIGPNGQQLAHKWCLPGMPAWWRGQWPLMLRI